MPEKDDEFGTAFDEEEAAGGVEPGQEEGEPGGEVTPEAGGARVEPESEGGGEGGEGGEGGGGEGGEGADLRELYEKEQQRFRSFDGRYKKEKEEWTGEREQLLQELESLKAGARQEPETQEPPQEDEFLTKFKADYGEDVQKAVSLIAKQEAERLVQSTLSEKIDPLQQTVAGQQVAAHFQRIAQEHPDYQEVSGGDEFKDWVDAQPNFLAKSYRQIIKSGPSEDVNELLTAYKETLKPEEDTKREEKAAAAAAVPTRRGSLPKAKAAMDDFDSAWDEAPD